MSAPVRVPGRVSREGEIAGEPPSPGEGNLGTIAAMNSGQSHQHRRTAKGTTVLFVITVVLVGIILVGAAASGSFESLTQLASRHGIHPARFFPIVLDGTLVGFLIIDILATIAARPMAVLHTVVRLFGGLSIWFNFVAGLPDVVGGGMRAMFSVLLVLLSEVVRLFILKGQRAGKRIPFKRWLLAPGATFKIWRRMHLWGVDDYGTVLELEMTRSEAIQALTGALGKNWRRRVERSLVWQLDEGVRIPEARARVDRMLGSQAPPARSRAGGSGRPAQARPASAGRKRSASARVTSIDRQVQALALYQANPEITGSQIGRELGLSPVRGRAILADLRKQVPESGQIPAVRD